MKIYHILSLIILSLLLSGCVIVDRGRSDNKLIVADEKFCLAPTSSNISSDEAYEIAKKSECAKVGIIKEDCNCDSSTYDCSFTLETDKTDCNPVCLVNLKTQAVKIDWRCNNESAGP